MSRCVGCKHAVHDQFKGYPGRWSCFHPYRHEISNKGDFTYPANDHPRITICETPAADYNQPDKHLEVLQEAQTPVWCYIEVVERAKREQPGFDPDKQREILWPREERDTCTKSLSE